MNVQSDEALEGVRAKTVEELDAELDTDPTRRVRCQIVHRAIFRIAMDEPFPSKKERVLAYIGALEVELVAMRESLKML